MMYSHISSTGKRRYGHPAITGVLPVPWLPIKQGQSLNRHRDTEDDGSPAVVLTLRKKYSVHRETARLPSQQSNGSTSSGASANQALSPGEEGIAPSDRSVLGNPWEDQPPARPRPHAHRHSNSTHVRHRLSFDAASGVIMLPDDENWMDAEDSDSDDYGEMQNSTLSEVGTRDSPGLDAGYQATAGSPGHGKRYSTYYHHPERRRQLSLQQQPAR